jgi:hypothetical protein
MLVGLERHLVLYASGDSQTQARLVPVCERALRLQGKQVVDPLAHHVRLVERVFQDASGFDVIHFYQDYLHFSLCRRQARPEKTKGCRAGC